MTVKYIRLTNRTYTWTMYFNILPSYLYTILTYICILQQEVLNSFNWLWIPHTVKIYRTTCMSLITSKCTAGHYDKRTLFKKLTSTKLSTFVLPSVYTYCLAWVSHRGWASAAASTPVYIHMAGYAYIKYVCIMYSVCMLTFHATHIKLQIIKSAIAMCVHVCKHH